MRRIVSRMSSFCRRFQEYGLTRLLSDMNNVISPPTSFRCSGHGLTSRISKEEDHVTTAKRLIK